MLDATQHDQFSGYTPQKCCSLELFDAWNANQLANNLVTLSYLLWYDILVCMFVYD